MESSKPTTAEAGANACSDADKMWMLTRAIRKAEWYRKRLERLKSACEGWNASLHGSLDCDIREIETTRKRLAEAKENIERSQELKRKRSETPHADGDFSYTCGKDYCRCMQ